jgi:microcystin degradation protein MlrC
MRVALAQIIQESNSFVPFRTTLANFEAQYIRRGREVLDRLGGARIEIAGMAAVLREAGIEPVPWLATHGSCGGPLTRETFETLIAYLLAPLRAGDKVDAVLLALHGAMAVEDENDAESEILERLRALLPKATPIGVSLDLHAHVTERLLQPGVFFIGYREYPHIDMFETGERVARLLLEVLGGRQQPVMALAKRAMLASPVEARTGEGPLAEVVAAARAAETGPVLHCSLFPVQPWLDFEDLGFGVLVCADADRAAAQRTAESLADLAFARREALLPRLMPLEDAIRTGLSSPGLTSIGDGGDAPSGGAGGDNVTVLKTLLAMGADKAERLTYLTLVDAPAAAKAAAAGVGATVALALGHSLSVDDGEPITVTGTVRLICDGVYTLGDKGMQGAETHMGLTVVLAIGALRLAVRSVGNFEWDTGLFTSVGLDLRRAAIAFVKSPSHFRVAFGPVSERLLVADTPGPTTCNLRRVPFRKVRRPIHPLDPI